MDVSIGQFRLTGRLVGAADGGFRSDDAVDLLTGPSARQRMFEAFSSAFDGDEVLVIRSLSCTSTLRPDAHAGPDTLAGSIIASAAQVLRGHPTDDDHVVRFPDEAAYVAAYIHDCLDGHQNRWYYQSFEPYRRGGVSTDWSALLAAHRARRWQILARVASNGDLETLLGTHGDDWVEDLATDTAGPENGGWSPLINTAAEIIGRATGAASTSVDPGLATAIANTEPPPDWRDPESIGAAVAAAAAAILGAAKGVLAGVGDQLLDAARQHEWFDQAAFAAALAARRAGGAPTDFASVEPVLSARARSILADLVSAVDDPRLSLDPRRPSTDANLVRLVTALIHTAPRWGDDELARSVAAHVLRVWSSGAYHDAAVQGSRPSGTAATAELVMPRADSAPPSTGTVAALLDRRFPSPDPPEPGASPTAAGLLLLRMCLDLGITPYLLDPVGGSRTPLLAALLRRWSGVPVSSDIDPLLEILGALSGDIAERRDRLFEACRLAARRLLGQRLASPPLHAVTVPFDDDALATVVVDREGRLLPLGSLAGQTRLEELVEEAGLILDAELADADVRCSVTGTLASVSGGAGGSGDRPSELLLDLLAASSVQAWARWLRGFSTASVPFLLATCVRHQAWVTVDSSTVTVLLAPQSHDVVLRLADYFAPIDVGPVLGGRRVRFVTGDGLVT